MRRMTLALSITAAAALASGMSSATGGIGKSYGAGQDDVIRVETTLVTVPVSVMDRNGKFVPDLKQDQFRLFEDGVEQQIAFFESSEKPFTVALMLDTSDSASLKLKEIQSAAIAFLGNLRADDRVVVVGFDGGVRELAGPTNDQAALREGVLNASTGGGTSLYDALDIVVRLRLSKMRGRKAIVLFTDGVDTTSRTATYESTLRAAEELDALVYSIQYNTYDDSDGGAGATPGSRVRHSTPKGEPLSVAYERGNRFMRQLADKTGGRFYFAGTLGALTRAFERIAAELREQYSLGYYPANRAPGRKRRELKVRVSVPNVAVVARKSYVLGQRTR